MIQAIFIPTHNRMAIALHVTSPTEAGGGLSERSKLREGAKSLL
jgi:hypothetical protein